MKITISTTAIDKVSSRNLAVGLFSDEKPPRGASGLLDWRLNGFLSREMIRGRITGEFQETCVIFRPPKIQAEAILFYGLGDSQAQSLQRFAEAGREIMGIMRKMQRADFALNIPTSAAAADEVAPITEALLTGCFAALATWGEHDAELPWLLINQNLLNEAVSGAQRFALRHGVKAELQISPLENVG